MVITLSLAGMDREGFFTGPGSKSAGRILRISTWNHVLEQWKPWFALICEDIQIYPTFIIMIAIMITIIVFHCGFPELERFESVTFILPCHCPAFLTIFAARCRVNLPFPTGRFPAGRGVHPCSLHQIHLFIYNITPVPLLTHFPSEKAASDSLKKRVNCQLQLHRMIENKCFPPCWWKMMHLGRNR